MPNSKTPPVWARWGHGFSALNFRRADECAVALRWLDPGEGERILDIGCGDGFYDWRISHTGAKVTGIDLHVKRLAFARRHYANGRTEFLNLDAERVDLPAGSFDKAVCLCVIEHLGDDERVLRNVHKALKPGGLFVLSADSLSNSGITPKERERHRRRYAVKAFYTMDVARDKLSRAGFEIDDWGYVLHTAGALRLVRMSWKLDDLPKPLIPLRYLFYVLLGAAYKASPAALDHRPPPSTPGLTLIVKARRRIEQAGGPPPDGSLC